MAEEPENIVLVLLRDIRAKVEAVDAKVEGVDAKVQSVDARVQRLEKQVEELNVAVTYSLGQSTQTQFRQARQGARIDDQMRFDSRAAGRQSDALHLATE